MNRTHSHTSTRFTNSTLRRALLVALASLAVSQGGAALAQTYPSRPIRMIIPFSPGGSTDVLGRIIGQKLATALGQSLVVENRSGADGLIGMDALAKSPADGYTILFCTTSTLALNPSLYAGKLPYDPDKAFAEVILTASAPNILVVNKNVPAKSVPELVALAKSQPGGLNAGSGATMLLLNTKLFESKAGATVVAVPYKGTAPSLAALMGGQIDMMFDQITSSLPLVNDGRIRALAVTSAKRYPGLPNVPTMMESGIADFETTSWWGILAPGGTPAAVVAKLNAELNKVLTDPEVVAKIHANGAVPGGGTPRQFADFAKEEQARWSKVIKAFNITAN